MSNDMIKITISGPKGIGKTTLAKHLAAIMHQQGFNVTYKNAFRYPISDVHKLIEKGTLIGITEVSLPRKSFTTTSSFSVKEHRNQDGANIPETHIHSDIKNCTIGIDADERPWHTLATFTPKLLRTGPSSDGVFLNRPSGSMDPHPTVAVGFGILRGDGTYVTGSGSYDTISYPLPAQAEDDEGLTPANIRRIMSEKLLNAAAVVDVDGRFDEIAQKFRDIPTINFKEIDAAAAREVANKINLDSVVGSVLLSIHEKAEDGHLEIKYKLKYIPKHLRKLVISELKHRGFKVDTNLKRTKITISYENFNS